MSCSCFYLISRVHAWRRMCLWSVWTLKLFCCISINARNKNKIEDDSWSNEFRYLMIRLRKWHSYHGALGALSTGPQAEEASSPRFAFLEHRRSSVENQRHSSLLGVLAGFSSLIVDFYFHWSSYRISLCSRKISFCGNFKGCTVLNPSFWGLKQATKMSDDMFCVTAYIQVLMHTKLMIPGYVIGWQSREHHILYYCTMM